jgi:hypothetical protein
MVQLRLPSLFMLTSLPIIRRLSSHYWIWIGSENTLSKSLDGKSRAEPLTGLLLTAGIRIGKIMDSSESEEETMNGRIEGQIVAGIPKLK